MIRVLSLDPGGCTGICEATIHTEENLFQLNYWQKKWLEADIWQHLHEYKPDALVYESFQYRAGGMRQSGILRPVELIGVLRLYEQLYAPLSGTYPQGSSKAVGKDAIFTDLKIKEMGLYIPGLEHGRVALKHLLYWAHYGGGTQFVDRHHLNFELS
jgi:hypothetical protein